MNLYKSETFIKDLETAAKNTVGIEKLKNKTVFITGATGTIGSFIVDVLMRYNDTDNAEIDVYASGRSIDRLARRFGEIKTDKLHFVEHDILNPIDFDFNADYIIHAAGNAYPAVFASNPVETIVGNISGTYNLLEYAKTHGTKRFLYVSSGEVYGQGDLSLDEFNENYGGYVSPTEPRSCYPGSKRTAETLCASYTKEYGLETVIVRPCHTYGPCMTSADNRANAQFFNNVLNDEDIIMKSAGTQMRSYCYIADCASASLTILLSGNAGEAYNSANPNARTTIAGFAHEVAAAAGKQVIFADPTAADIAQRTPIAKQVLSSDKLSSLGWRGEYSVKKGVENTIKILKEAKVN